MNNYEFGTIIHVKYFGFKRNENEERDIEELNGTFCVCYDEGYDTKTYHRGNILAFKITTSISAAGSYSVSIPRAKNNFLRSDCTCQCNKIHTLDKQFQVKETLGVLDEVTKRRVHNKYMELQAEVERQQHEAMR
jgi:mRNA-degrading endonuclease toxin of MazEF toxin-antitoxin module